MTPSKKAENLLNKYTMNMFRGSVPLDIHVQQIKKCALIAVDESIENLEFIHKPEYVSILIQGQFIDIYEAIEYWKKVKEEIEKQ